MIDRLIRHLTSCAAGANRWARGVRIAGALLLIGALPAHAQSPDPAPQVRPLADLTDVDRRARQAVAGPDGHGTDGPLAPIGYTLAELHAAFRAHTAAGKSSRTFQPATPGLQFANGFIVVDALAVDDAERLLRDLQALGLRNGAHAGRLVSGRLPISALPGAAALSSLHSAWPALAAPQVGATTSQGAPAQQSGALRTALDTDGSGVVVGILSDSYNQATAAATTAAQDVASGDLPGPGNPNGYATPVQVLAEPDAAASDEGRAMAQIVHDVAPGAELAFHTAFRGLAGFATGIRELAEGVGAQVIVDDVLFLAEPMFQDGVVAQAVNEAVYGQGVTYVTSSGNNGRNGYASPFRASGQRGPLADGELHDFDPGPGVDVLQSIEIPVGAQVQLPLHWAQPAASVGGRGAETNLEFFLATKGGTVLRAERRDNVGGNPFEFLSFRNDGTIDADGDGRPDTSFRLGIERVEGPAPSQLRYVYISRTGDIRLEEYGGAAPTLYGHPNAEGAITTAAAAYFNTPAFGQSPPLAQAFSSLGGIPVLYDELGLPLPSPDRRRKPDLTGPDGGNTTFFGQQINDGDSFPNFFGTSAAAPHIAGLAALLRAANPDLSPDRTAEALRAAVIDIPRTDDQVALAVGYDATSGAGLVQGDRVTIPPARVRAFQADPVGEQAVRVAWEEVADAGIEAYTLEQSYLGSPFEPVRSVAGQGATAYMETVEGLEPGSHAFRLRWTRTDGTEEVGPRAQAVVQVAEAVEIHGPFPNPTAGRFQLELTVQRRQGVVIALYDVLGRLTKVLTSEVFRANRPRVVNLDASAGAPVAAGRYFIRLVGEDFDTAVPVMVLR